MGDVDDFCALHLSRVLQVGHRVRVQGLVSVNGQELNGCTGTIVKAPIDVQNGYACSDRFGVQLDRLRGPKSIKVVNLRRVWLRADTGSPGNEEFNSEEEAGVEASSPGAPSEPAKLSTDELSINAQLSDALLRGRSVPHVVLLTFSRCPQAFLDALSDSPELVECQRVLKMHNLHAHVGSPTRFGPQVFVYPENYQPLEEALRLSGFPLSGFRCWHVFADAVFADLVTNIATQLPKRHKIYPRGSSIVPLGFAASVLESSCEASVFKTFIDIHVPSSLCSSANKGSAQTASTTEADFRKGPQRPRPCGRHSAGGSREAWVIATVVEDSG